jgi:hypothetical protein
LRFSGKFYPDPRCKEGSTVYSWVSPPPGQPQPPVQVKQAGCRFYCLRYMGKATPLLCMSQQLQTAGRCLDAPYNLPSFPSVS